ncbi:MAG: small basic protein [Candidatus Omnitrophota bacterium]|nr:small basic protein [Candidatus Omnitrophota bacterium]
MSLHPSLKIDKAGVQQRTVQTRIERIKELMKKGLWKEETSVTGLPKTRIVRIKAKKKVKAEGPADGGATGPAADGGAAPAAAGAAKPAASASGGKAAPAAKPAAGAAKAAKPSK